ncbi:MAG: HAMP domain-containing histidine kinase [Oscillospiraceae bacterium]|nr:HAMP domain-containing histidine kinase [Oscillospiraceae bacterium]
MVYVLLALSVPAAVILAVRLCLLKKTAREITSALPQKLEQETNTLIGISSRDRDMRALTECINQQLRVLREERLLYRQGNAELKNAVTNLSHDLRTPLTAICGYLDMMQKSDDPEKTARYLSVIRERTELMKQLTEELFRYSVILSDERSTETETVCVNQLLAESIGSFYPALTGRGITPEISIPEQRVLRQVNRAELSRVFTNLLSNAVKYSSGDLRITMTEDGEITFSNTAKELTAVQVEQLFDRFYTVEAARYSTGLGLSIARTLAERMGGTITAALHGQELTIRFRLPEPRPDTA